MSNQTLLSPSSWTSTTLGCFCGQRGQSIEPQKKPEQVYELYSVPSFPSGKPEIVKGKEIGSNKQIVEVKSVLLCKINPRINRAWVVGNFSKHPKIASTEWIVFPSNEDLIPEFLSYFLQQNKIREFLSTNASGVGGSLMRVKPSTLKDFPFSYPRKENQLLIVEEIEKQFTRLEAGVEALKRVQANLKRYRAAVLKAACEGKLVPTEAELAKKEKRSYEPAFELLQRIFHERSTKWQGRGKYKEPTPPNTSNLPPLPEGWIYASIEQLGSTGEQAVLTGPFGTNLGRNDFTTSGVPILTISCLKSRGINMQDANYVSHKKAKELERYRLKTGDFLFSRMAAVGRAGIITEKENGALFNYHIMRLRIASNAILSKYYLSYVRGAAQVERYIRDVNHGATRDGINTDQLLNMPVALPPLAEQKRIVAEVERRLSVIDELEKLVADNLSRSARLRQSILQKAFSGKV